MKTAFASGLDILLDSKLGLLEGQRVGLVSHPAAVTRSLEDNVQALLSAGIHLTVLFGLEHGFTSAARDGVAVEDSRDPRTGLPVISLYGPLFEPTADMLEQVDVLVYDIQEVGARFYTYLSTLYCLLRAAGQHHCPVVVLDRPNPITGVRLEGPVLEDNCRSFVGMVHIPLRHGLTPGELALFINAEYAFNADLTILPMHGWSRSHWFDQTGRIWVPTSPGIPRFETTLLYPGTCLLEGTNLSEGRGTALPFELLGAPWVDQYRLADHLNERNMPGVFARPASFIPAASKYQGEVCQGIQLHILDRETLSPLSAALEIIAACQSLHPQHFAFLEPPEGDESPRHFDLLAGTQQLRKDLQAGRQVDEIASSWEAELAAFSKVSQTHLLYE